MLKRNNVLNSPKPFRRGNIECVTQFSTQVERSDAVTQASAAPSTPLNRILVLIGPHQGGAEFLRYALQFAQPQQTEVHLATMGRTRAVTSFAFGPPRRTNSSLTDLAKRLGYEVILHRIPSDTEPAVELRRLAMSRRIEIMFMVTQGGPGLLSVFLKSAHERILRLSPCPVVSVPENALNERLDRYAAGWPLRTILTPVQFPPRTSEYLRLAGAFASNFSARVDLLGVQEHVKPVIGVTDQRQARTVRKDELNAQIADLAAQAFPGAVRGLSLASLGVPFCQATLQATRALQPNLITIGVPTRRWRVQARVDRATERILRRVAQPVLCVPEPESQPIRSCRDSWGEVWHQDFKRARSARRFQPA